MRKVIQVACIVATLGLNGPLLSVSTTAQVKDDVKEAGKDATEAGKKAGEVGKDVGEAGKDVGKKAGEAGKEIGSTVKDAAKKVARTTKNAVKGTPKGSTGQCKDGTFTKAKSKAGACSKHGGVEKWF